MTAPTKLMLIAALRPHHEMEEREALDWSPRFLSGSRRREVLAVWEYQGADLPAGAHPHRLAERRGLSVRETRA
jgi:hypothetical protein